MFVSAARGDPAAASMRWIFLAVLVAGSAWIY